MAELEELLIRSRALAAERDISLRTMLSRLQLEQEEARELEVLLVLLAIVRIFGQLEPCWFRKTDAFFDH